ncbi:MAG: metal ABC transporter ATP-binding protein [Andreesenia angusta]|nr:metal ABC transporter ATP-binding protein [Andreesenia angusta]
MDSIIRVDDLTVAYREKPVLRDIDLKIEKGRITAIVGPNGAGKSTLIKSILNLIKPIAGRVLIEGDVYSNKNQDIAYIPQSGSVDWDFPTDVFDVVLMGRYGKLGWFKRPKKEDKEKAERAIERVGMADYKSRQISELSGGQQQRVFLARALVQEANIYFMDEPFKGVDAKTELTIVNLLRELKEQGKTLVIVHHDLRTVPEYFDDVILLNKTIIDYGKVEDVFTDENIDRAYSIKREAVGE